MLFLQQHIAFLLWVLVRVIVALLEEVILFLLKEQQSAAQGHTAQVQYVVI